MKAEPFSPVPALSPVCIDDDDKEWVTIPQQVLKNSTDFELDKTIVVSQHAGKTNLKEIVVSPRVKSEFPAFPHAMPAIDCLRSALDASDVHNAVSAAATASSAAATSSAASSSSSAAATASSAAAASRVTVDAVLKAALVAQSANGEPSSLIEAAQASLSEAAQASLKKRDQDCETTKFITTELHKRWMDSLTMTRHETPQVLSRMVEDLQHLSLVAVSNSLFTSKGKSKALIPKIDVTIQQFLYWKATVKTFDADFKHMWETTMDDLKIDVFCFQRLGWIVQKATHSLAFPIGACFKDHVRSKDEIRYCNLFYNVASAFLWEVSSAAISLMAQISGAKYMLNVILTRHLMRPTAQHVAQITAQRIEWILFRFLYLCTQNPTQNTIEDMDWMKAIAKARLLYLQCDVAKFQEHSMRYAQIMLGNYNQLAA